MSGLERETPPAGDRGRGEDSAHDPCKITPKVAGIDGAGDGNCLLSGRTSDAVQFLQGWAPEGPWVLTSIVPDGELTAATFGPGDVVKMRDWIQERQGVENLYFMVNRTFRAMRTKASKADVAATQAYHVDVDPRVGEDAEAERARAFKLLREYKPAPTVIIDSGGGAQGFWLLEAEEDNPCEPGDETRHLPTEERNLTIEVALQADACHNIDRIMRLPGTVNLPNKKKRDKGRVPRLATVVEVDWTRLYKPEQFARTKKAAKDSGAAVTGGRAPVVLSASLPRIESLDELGPKVSDRLKAMIVQGTDPEEPGKYGSRSEAAWAVICMMVRAGCSDDQIAAVILDPDYKVSAHVLDQPKPHDYAARQIARAKVEAWDPDLLELNARHAVIESLGVKGQCRIMERLPTPDGRGVIAFQSFDDFGNRYDNREKRVGSDKQGNDIMMPLGKWWKKKAERRQFKTIAFKPNGPEILPDNVLNLWTGLGIRPKAGSWDLIRKHILEVLADGKEEYADYITRWVAFLVQFPDRRAEVALTLLGEKGTGKGLFGGMLMQFLGRHSVKIQGVGTLDAKFNVHLRDCVFLFADEIDWDPRRSDALLKGMITEDTLFIEPKGVDATNQPNFLHLLITSDNNFAVPAGMGERRYAVFKVSNKMKEKREYFEALKAEMDGGGLEAFLHHLLAMDLTGWHPRWNIPQTNALSQQRLANLKDENRVAREMLMGGVTGGVEKAATGDRRVVMVRALIKWALDQKIIPTDPGEQQMTAALKMMGMEKAELKITGSTKKKEKCWVMPPLAEARATWAKNMGLQVDWPEVDDWTAFNPTPDR